MQERVALITGAGRGIGRAIAVALGAVGWRVVVNYQSNAEAATETRALVEGAGGQALTVQADIGRTADRERLVQQTLNHFGRIDLLVNNAGMGVPRRGDMLDTTEESYDRVMDVNLKGPFFLTQRVANAMLQLMQAGRVQEPKIVNIGSISAYTSSTNRAEYCLSKAGLTMMTALFADRLAEHGILVYEVRPGIIETDMTGGVHEKYDQMIANGLTPIRRWGRPEDVGAAVLAIADGDFPFSTGEIINVDGGFHLRRL